MKCNRVGCPNIATRQIVAKLAATRDGVAAMAEFDVFICDNHALDIDWDHVFSSDGFESICDLFAHQGFARPKKRFSQIITKKISR